MRVVLTILAVFVLTVSQSPAFAQGQGPGGPGSPGGGPPPGKGPGGGETETTANNLSYPATFTATAPTLQGTAGSYTLPPDPTPPTTLLGTSWSYGCAMPQTIGTTTYPNYSCVDLTSGAPLSFEACKAVCVKSDGVTPIAVERIYWQKTSGNVWQAQSEGPTAGARDAAFVNWGDNLETGQWTTNSVIRVETTPFSALASPSPSALLGFQMWHVSGQGTNELWGVRATGPDYDATTKIVPYVYDSPYTIVHTAKARLNLALLGPAAGGTCGDPPPLSPYNGLTWKVAADTKIGTWLWLDENAAETAVLYTNDLPYTPELNIGGKFVYGYNWNVRNEPVPSGTNKGGWWRLTFYTTDGSVNFPNAARLTEPDYTYTYVPSPTSAIRPREDTGPKYFGTVDSGNNLTYMDICLNASSGSGRR